MDFASLQDMLPFGADGLYNSIIALVLFLFGLAILLKAGKMWGLIPLILGIAWLFVTFAHLVF